MCARYGTARKGKRRVEDGRGEKMKGKEGRGGLRRGEKRRGREGKNNERGFAHHPVLSVYQGWRLTPKPCGCQDWGHDHHDSHKNTELDGRPPACLHHSPLFPLKSQHFFMPHPFLRWTAHLSLRTEFLMCNAGFAGITLRYPNRSKL